jgi:hypothetical protein
VFRWREISGERFSCLGEEVVVIVIQLPSTIYKTYPSSCLWLPSDQHHTKIFPELLQLPLSTSTLPQIHINDSRDFSINHHTNNHNGHPLPRHRASPLSWCLPVQRPRRRWKRHAHQAYRHHARPNSHRPSIAHQAASPTQRLHLRYWPWRRWQHEEDRACHVQLRRGVGAARTPTLAASPRLPHWTRWRRKPRR